jgi:hypothetical protein
MHAAVDALGSYRIGGSRVLDVSMRDVVASTVLGHHVEPPAVEPSEGGWVLKHRARDSRVERPWRREPTGVTAAPGRDTELWRNQL